MFQSSESFNPFGALGRAADLLDPPADPYWSDPEAWAHDMILWPEDEGLVDYQAECLMELHNPKGTGRVCVRGPHGLGKTMMESIAILHYADTRDRAKADWKVPTTASVWRQLDRYLWPEIHKWARRMRWDKIGRQRYNERSELQVLNLVLATGQAFAVASDDHTAIEGAHADYLFYCFDEAKAIPSDTFDAAEGAFSGVVEGTGREALAMALSTPGPPNGRFWEIQRRAAGYEDWWVRHVTVDEAIAAKRLSPAWVEQRAKQWGEASAVFKNRVLGEFATEDEDGIIPLAWVEKAQERWAEWSEHPEQGVPMDRLGVDVARGGVDSTVVSLKYGPWLKDIRVASKADTMETAGAVKGILDANPGAIARIDVIGIGAGVVDRLREQGAPVEAFTASGKCQHTDVSGELGFVNRRACSWWTMRELLDPSNGYLIALPPDDMLIGDLTAPHWKVTSASKIQVESKEEIKKRLGRSPDYGDSVAMAFAPDEPVDGFEGVLTYDEHVTIGPAT